MRSVALGTLLVAIGCNAPASQLVYEDASAMMDRHDTHASTVPPGYDANWLGPDALACGGTARALSQTNAEVILVVDRSGSMYAPGTDGLAKWSELLRSLSVVLPREDSRIAFGLATFPIAGAGASSGSDACMIGAQIDVRPAYHEAPAILAALDRYGPSGGTPTAAALQSASQYFASEPDPIAQRYLVLVTDGGPNCNSALRGPSCRCSSPAPSCDTNLDPTANLNCLDDARTVADLRVLAGDGIRTFVVGLPGTESFADVLDAMAVAGGEARSIAPRYFDAASTSDLVAAMNSITTSLVDCTFRLDIPPSDPTMVDVRLGGMRIPFDPMHRNGWDWVPDSMSTTIEFYGSACDSVRAASGGEALIAAFGCPPLPAPP